MPTHRTRGNGQKLKGSEFHMNIRKISFTTTMIKCRYRLRKESVVIIFGETQNPTEHSPEHLLQLTVLCTADLD